MQQLDLKAAQQTLQSAPIGILLLGADGCIQWYNDRLLGLLDLKAEQLRNQNVKTLANELRGVFVDPPEMILLQHGDQQRWLRCHTQQSNGSTVIFYVDITEEQRLKLERDKLSEELQRLTTRDPITGLPNQRALLQGLEPLVSRSRRYSNPLSLIKLNVCVRGAKLSLPKQEEAWRRVGQALKDQMRWADIIGRYQGSDFLLILPETPEDAAQQLADKISSLIAEIKFNDAEGNLLALDPYCGVASWTKGDDSALMIHRADERMQAARQAGTPVLMPS